MVKVADKAAVPLDSPMVTVCVPAEATEIELEDKNVSFAIVVSFVNVKLPPSAIAVAMVFVAAMPVTSSVAVALLLRIVSKPDKRVPGCTSVEVVLCAKVPLKNKVSVPSPPATVSSFVNSVPVIVIRSLPTPPSMLSLPAPPLIVSSPAPEATTSLPAPPVMLSLPAPPVMAKPTVPAIAGTVTAPVAVEALTDLRSAPAPLTAVNTVAPAPVMVIPVGAMLAKFNVTAESAVVLMAMLSKLLVVVFAVFVKATVAPVVAFKPKARESAVPDNAVAV